MTKKIMSIAAIAAILTTGVSAFDSYNGALATDRSGTGITYSSYRTAVKATAPLSLSTTRKGDALIYPVFTQDEGYGTEIVVRNTSDRGIVAKAVMYAGVDSEELLDFNIYLSPKDVCRFKIENGKITSSDGSIRTSGLLPKDITPAAKTTAKNDTTSIKFANTLAFSHDISAAKYKKGYIAVFGMIQSDTDGEFHKKHADLYAAYAQLLDDKRPSWRDLRNANVLLGSLFVSSETVAPNIALTAAGTTVSWTNKNSTTNSTTFEPVADVLSGDLRIYNSNGYDMLLPAKAISGFSNDANANTTLWTEGEYAAIGDRCIDVNATAAFYDATCLNADAAKFNVATAIYTYAHKSGATVDNQVVITQPYKRMQLQLGNTAGYLGSADKTSTKVETGQKYYFSNSSTVYDEDEGKTEAQVSTGIILSGIDNDVPVVTKYHKEVQMIKPDAFEQSATNKEVFKDKDGFATFGVGVPAIITQMVASKAGNSTELNIIYSEIN